jgi:N-acetyl-alpha-D-muramate 1-phosphate uridylyltransferase
MPHKSPAKAMVLAAGQGVRMRPLTDRIPKPLIEVGGKPLIDHVLDRLAATGVERAVVNVHHLADQIEKHLAGRRAPKIVISDERAQLLDTGGGVVKAMPYFGDAPFFILNSDSIWVEGASPALPAMLAKWDAARMDGLLLLADMQTAKGYEGSGDFVLKAEGRIGRARDSKGPAYAYPGVQIVHPRLFRDAPAGAFSTNVMWDRAIAAGSLFGTVLDGVWIHVGTPQARDEAEAYLRAPA